MNIPLPRLSLRAAALLAAALVYGLFSSPTPPGFGWAEISVAAALAVAVGWSGIMQLIKPGAAPWIVAGQALLFYGLSVPVIGALIAGNDPALILRDILPFLFLILPVLFSDGRDMRRTILIAAAFIGVAFAARVALPVWMQNMPHSDSGANALYLAIAPTVVFAAIFCAGLAGQKIYQSLSLYSIAAAAILSTIALLPFAAMVMTLQRASLGLALMALLFLLGLAVWRNPLRAAGPLLLTAVVVIMFGAALTGTIESLLQKQGLVGSNMRLQEAQAVFDAVSPSPLQTIFGQGWGATIASPAVGGVTVNYTHNLFTTYWLKAGLAGVFLVFIYLFSLGLTLLPLVRHNPLLAAALTVPLVIDVLLYASFKSLDFGLILLLIAVFAPESRLHRNTS